MTERKPTIGLGEQVLIRRGPKQGAKWISKPTVTIGAADSVTIDALTTDPPPPEPEPEPEPPPTGPTFYIAPNGSDSAAGTLAAPWKTILRATTGRAPGDTILARGGTYTGGGGYNWKSSGTAAAPITLRAYPGETPHFDGTGVSHCIIVSSQNYAVIDGLSMTGFCMGPSGDGAILTLNARGVTIQNCRITNSGVTFQQDHHIYVNSGCADIVIRNCYFEKTPGAAVHMYHDPGPTNVLVENCTMKGPAYWGVVVGSNASNVKINGCTFSGNTSNIDNQRGTNVTVNGAPLPTGQSL